jgi:hypothetical protein
MLYLGVRYSIPKGDGRTKVGFEFNQGSRYWFNFAQAEDDIIAPKSNTRGEVYETYLTQRINDHFIFKAEFIATTTPGRAQAGTWAHRNDWIQRPCCASQPTTRPTCSPWA